MERNMPVFEQMTNTLEEIFVEIDTNYIADMVKWGLGRKAALREFKARPDHSKEYRLDPWGVFEQMCRLCGGKTWYNVFNENGDAGVEAFMIKNSKGVITSRNAKIAMKLEKVGATEIKSQSFARTSDGFDGFFVVQTDAGEKRISINTIIAGGYNIQCIHQRTLVKVK
jgi:hypothetical protein